MGIDPNRLAPWAQAQILDKLRAQNALRATQMPQDERKRGGKYNNTPTEKCAPGGLKIRFDSKKEAARYDELMLMLKAGQIEERRLQAAKTLQAANTTQDGTRGREMWCVEEDT